MNTNNTISRYERQIIIIQDEEGPIKKPVPSALQPNELYYCSYMQQQLFEKQNQLDAQTRDIDYLSKTIESNILAAKVNIQLPGYFVCQSFQYLIKRIEAIFLALLKKIGEVTRTFTTLEEIIHSQKELLDVAIKENYKLKQENEKYKKLTEEQEANKKFLTNVVKEILQKVNENTAWCEACMKENQQLKELLKQREGEKEALQQDLHKKNQMIVNFNANSTYFLQLFQKK